MLSCQEQVAELVHTKDGSRVVREFIVQGTAKVRITLVCVYVYLITLALYYIGPETNREGAQATHRGNLQG